MTHYSVAMEDVSGIVQDKLRGFGIKIADKLTESMSHGLHVSPYTDDKGRDCQHLSWDFIANSYHHCCGDLQFVHSLVDEFVDGIASEMQLTKKYSTILFQTLPYLEKSKRGVYRLKAIFFTIPDIHLDKVLKEVDKYYPIT